MGHDIRSPIGLIGLVLVRVNAEGPFLVRVGCPDAQRNGEDGNVHHDHEAKLHGRADVGEVEGCRTRVPGRGRLEDGREDSLSDREGIHFWIVQIEDNDQESVDEIQSEDDAKEDPGGTAREEERVASTGVSE